MQVQRQVDIFLDQIYVSLQAVRRQEVVEIEREHKSNYTQRLTIGSSSPHDLDEPSYYDEPVVLESSFSTTTTKTITQKLDLSEAVRQNQYNVILGSPGAGKTTLLRYLALHYAFAKRDSQEIVTDGEQELGRTLLPVFFRIADYAERLDKQPNLSLLDYLRQYHIEAEVIARILETMQQGQCLMLLDGLDEVFDQESRRQIVERINKFVDEFPGNKFVITSRIAGYRDVQLSSRFAEFTIEDMDSKEVEKFLHRWCRAVEKAQQPEATEEQWQTAGDNQTREILEAIQDNEGVKRLTANPLLVTILALIHRNGARLPNRRVELYALAVKTLIEDWQLSKKLPDAPTVVLKESEVVRLLAPLAYWMHEEKPSGLVTQAEVEEQLAEKLAELNDIEPDTESVRQAVEEFLRKVRETTGLFVERAPGVYGFMHLTFEEYFVARCIADNDQSEILSIINSHFYEPRWNEPILLALGYYGIHFNTQVDKLLKKLFSNLDTYEPTLQGGEINIKNDLSQDATLVWSNSSEKSETSKLELKLKDLLFAGEVLTQVEVSNSSIRKKIIQKLVITYLCLDTDFEDDTTKQLLKLLRRIESFTQKGEVLLQLKQAVNDSKLSEENKVKAQLAILYVACSKADTQLVNCVSEITVKFNPTLFCGIRELVKELGEQMSPALENCQHISLEQNSKNALKFLTLITYLRKDNYDKAVTVFEELNQISDTNLSPYLDWSLAICSQENEEFHKANIHYRQCFEKLSLNIQTFSFRYLWIDRGICHRLHGKYQQSIECFEQALTIDRKSGNLEEEANTFWNIGKSYQGWGKFEQAISSYQQSREIYEQLDKELSVANLWGWMSNCYRDWGNYEQAIECLQNLLQAYQNLNNQPNQAGANSGMGHIYQEWDKYEQAIYYYQQSYELYKQLGREKDVGNQLFGLAICYFNLKDYNKAVDYYQQSRNLHSSLGDNKSVAIRYRRLAYTQSLLARNLEDKTQAFDLLAQAEQNIHQAIQINTTGAYTKNLAYDYIVLSLLISERLRLLPSNDSSLQERIAQFEKNYNTGLSYFDELGQTVDKADQVLDIARAYLEVGALENLDKAEQLAQESLNIFQEYNRCKLEASAYKLLGEIYLKRREHNHYNAEAIATQFLTESLQIYRALDLQEKASEVEKLLSTSGK